jgi:Phosphodiester glycosidase/FlgD Ig-like domain
VTKRGLLPVALAALLVSPSIAGAATTLLPNVKYQRQNVIVGGRVVTLHVVRFPRHGGLYQLRPVLSAGTVLGKQTVPSMQAAVARQATTVGVNGDLHSVANGRPTGLFLRDGVLSVPPAFGRSALGIAFDGRLLVGRWRLAGSWQPGSYPAHPLTTVNKRLREPRGVALYTPRLGGRTPRVPGSVEVVLSRFPPALLNGTLTGTVTAVRRHGGTLIPARGAVIQAKGFWRAKLLEEAPVGTQITVRLRIPGFPTDAADGIGGGPLLVRDGNPVQQADEQFSLSHLNIRHPRTAVGQLGDGRLMFLVADGRSSASGGLTMWQLAQQMARLGAVTAMSLDGGGSSTISFDGRVLNRPSDGHPRAVAGGLFLFYHGIYAPRPSRALITPNGDGIGERTTLTAKVVRPSIVDLKLLRPDGTIAWRHRRSVSPGKIRKVVGVPRMHDGPWRWVVEATESASGRVSTMTRSFKVNRTLGHLLLSRERLPVVPRRTVRVFISAVLKRQARVGVVVLTRSGKVRRILYQGARGRGKHLWSWDGRGAAGALVPGGTYVIRVRATNSFGTVTLTDTIRVIRVA